MDQMAIENCSIVSAKESLPELGINDRQVRVDSIIEGMPAKENTGGYG